MRLDRMRKTSILLLATYVSCLALAEVTHLHHHLARIDTESFAVHACGNVELHKPLDWIGQCTLCREGHGRLMVTIHEPSGHDLIISPLSVVPHRDETPHSETLSSQGPARAPPAS